ncbi:MAG: restriction endonuclease [Nitrospira sp.]|nr:restriction endonuclease [Nitrospira sp.]
MPIPDFQSLMLPVLKALSVGFETPISEVRSHVASAEGLTSEEVRELLPSGKQPVFTNRIAWAVAHMSHAGLVEKVRRGVYRLTVEGERLLVQTPTRIDLKVLSNYSAYAEWQMGKGTPSEESAPTLTITENASVTPEEALERAVWELRNELEAEVLERVRKAEPAFLERVVKDLLVAMGYGKGDAAMGQVTGSPGDGGIDVKIREDALGLDEVYLQAKRYAAGNSVGEGDLRDFVGAIDATGTTKGVFVTTSSFTKSAKAYVGKSSKRIILIDGKELARLMVEHDIGIRPKMEYKVKRIDEDYFESEDL